MTAFITKIHSPKSTHKDLFVDVLEQKLDHSQLLTKKAFRLAVHFFLEDLNRVDDVYVRDNKRLVEGFPHERIHSIHIEAGNPDNPGTNFAIAAMESRHVKCCIFSTQILYTNIFHSVIKKN